MVSWNFLLLTIISMMTMMMSSNAFSSSSTSNKPRPAEYYHEFMKTLPSIRGKTVAITGCSRGLGYVTASSVIQKGGRVLLLNRKTQDMEWYQQLLQEADTHETPQPIHIECDLLSFDSVNAASQKVIQLTSENGLDVLCCNAGIMLQPDEASQDGYDITASTNMLSHFLLVKNLLESLRASKDSARVVIMSSASGYGGPSFNPTFFTKRGGNLGGQKASYERYHQSKLANLAFCSALQDKLNNASAKIPNTVMAVACTPGVCGTDMFLHATSMFSKNGTPAPLDNVPNPLDGCMAQLKCIMDETVKPGELWGPGPNGSLERTDIQPPTILVDENTKQTLWKVCEDAVGKFEIS